MLKGGEEGSVLANLLNRVWTYRVTANILFCTCTINLAYPGANTELHLLLSLITQWLIILHSAIFFLSWIFKRTFLAEFVFKWFWVCSLPRSFLSRSLSSFSSFNLSPLHFSAVPLLSWFLIMMILTRPTIWAMEVFYWWAWSNLDWQVLSSNPNFFTTTRHSKNFQRNLEKGMEMEGQYKQVPKKQNWYNNDRFDALQVL